MDMYLNTAIILELHFKTQISVKFTRRFSNSMLKKNFNTLPMDTQMQTEHVLYCCLLQTFFFSLFDLLCLLRTLSSLSPINIPRNSSSWHSDTPSQIHGHITVLQKSAILLDMEFLVYSHLFYWYWGL